MSSVPSEAPEKDGAFAGSPRPRSLPRRWGKRAAFGLGSGLAFAALVVAAFLLSDNFHAVVPGQVYRSRQLEPKNLEDVVTRYGIRSVLNLRGSHEYSGWYKAEHQTLQRLGVPLFDHELSAGREVTPAELDALVQGLFCLPKPVLIHCEGGADRTGLVSAAWLLRVGGQEPEQAGQQLSLRFGHFPWLWSNSGAMDRSLARYAATLRHAKPLQPCRQNPAQDQAKSGEGQ